MTAVVENIKRRNVELETNKSVVVAAHYFSEITNAVQTSLVSVIK